MVMTPARRSIGTDTVIDERGKSGVWNVLGPDGKPYRLSQADRTTREMGAYASYLATSFRLAPYNPDAFINGKGYDDLSAMLNNAWVLSPFDTLRNAVLAKGLNVHPHVEEDGESISPESQELADALIYALNEIEDDAGNPTDPRMIVWNLLMGIHNGFHVGEIVWKLFEEGPYKGKLGWAEFAHKPCKQIGFDVDIMTLKVLNITSYTPLTGYQFTIPVEKVLRYTHQPFDGLPYGRSIGRSCYKSSFSVELLMKLRNLMLEIFGSPFLVGKGPKTQLPDIQQTLSQIRQGAPAAFIDEVDIQMFQLDMAGGQSFDSAIEMERQQCALAYLYNTLTTGVGENGGNRALGGVHQDTQDMGVAAKRIDIEQILNRQLARRFVRYNYGVDALAYCPTISLGQWDQEDMLGWAQAVGKLIDKGVMHPDEPQIRQRAGLAPMPAHLKADMDARRKAADAMKAEIIKAGAVPNKGDGKDGGKEAEKKSTLSMRKPKQRGDTSEKRKAA